MKSDGGIPHHGEIPDIDEDLLPTLENFIVLTGLRLIHPELPTLVKQRYGTELRSQTLSSIKPEISQSLGSLLEEIRASAESKVLRSVIRKSNYTFKSDSKPSAKNDRSCVLCKQAGCPYNHFLSKCKYLPEADKQYLRTGKIRQNVEVADEDTDSEETILSKPSAASLDSAPTYNLRVSTSHHVISKQSPQIKVFYRHHPLQLILDTGAEISMIKTSVAQSIGATINKSSQKALQADGVTPLSIAGETRLLVSRDNVDLKLEALVVSDLDIDILTGIPFMTTNDISVRSSKQQILIGDSQVFYYGSSLPESPFNRIRRTQAVVLRSPTTSVWPGDFYELSVPQEIAQGNCTLSIETRPDASKHPKLWSQPQLVECIGQCI